MVSEYAYLAAADRSAARRRTILFISQTYDTAIADELLAPHGIVCPRFGDYVGNLLDFVEEFPQL
ncbi:MAG: hypothetical protein IPP63_10855 [Chloracidobacterium sp.]|nr:hypothetical protein [Chloracidobacterium sp.]